MKGIVPTAVSGTTLIVEACGTSEPMRRAYSIRVKGVVQGVGFRPFVYRIASARQLAGWVRNGERGVEIFVEGDAEALNAFIVDLESRAPSAAHIAEVQMKAADPQKLEHFTIESSTRAGAATVPVSPDLAVCDECLAELFDPADRRYYYPYINCTNCGPRYSVIRELPYDRPFTTMAGWSLDDFCKGQYEDPGNRRFHAQPVACPECGPTYILRHGQQAWRGTEAIARAAALLRDGLIVAVKGLGGYHLACDGRNAGAVEALRERKFRKEKAFAVMAADLATIHEVAELSKHAQRLLSGVERPILLLPSKVQLPVVAPQNRSIGVMLAYTPLHYLLFAEGAPRLLVMTSANRSSEPIAYQDEQASTSLLGIADAFLVGERPIARRMDDSVMRVGVLGPTVVRRARGLSPAAVTSLPCDRPILALGADLKNSITLVVDGQAFVSQHIGDLDQYECFCSFESTIQDLLNMYRVNTGDLLLAHDAHPQFRSSEFAAAFPCAVRAAVQHHRAHIASVLAEQREWDDRILGVSFDGTGYGDDGAIWGGEFFVGSLRAGLKRVAHLRPALLPGGDAAARYPVQAAAGFLYEASDLTAPPFSFPPQFLQAVELAKKGLHTPITTSTGRFFDAVAALLGFTREVTFEGQAAMWIEYLAGGSRCGDEYPFPFDGRELDYRPLLSAVIADRLAGNAIDDIARRFHRGFASGVASAILDLCLLHSLDTVVLSGGVFQNQILLTDLTERMQSSTIKLQINHAVPANDGGISLGQAALAAFGSGA